MTTQRITAWRQEMSMTIRFFVSDCGRCGVIFGITTEMEERRREDHETFYCPNGHPMHFGGETPTEKRLRQAKESAERANTRLIAQRDQTRAAERDAALARAAEARLRWRVGNGVCPCCNRTFPGLAAHVATKHPDFLTWDVDRLSTRMVDALVEMRRLIDGLAEDEPPTVAPADAAVHGGTIRALAARGLVTRIARDEAALTGPGWAVAEQAAIRLGGGS